MNSLRFQRMKSLSLLILLIFIIRDVVSFQNYLKVSRNMFFSQLQSSSSVEEEITPTASIGTASVTHKAPKQEIIRRRNFAIISHPDAGKTTLTEKLLLFGGAIQDAGAVKARADQRKATSDWMEIEKQRGISVTSTVLSFQYTLANSNNQASASSTPSSTQQAQFHLNLLDTPGHQDFSEDTYRTLAAADNCVMLIDAAKGIEDRTRKLFEVCQMRQLPIFTFANKLDRPSLTPFDIIDQLEKEFGLICIPMNWPIGDGDEFQGVYDRSSREVHLFTRGNRRKKLDALVLPITHPDLQETIGETLYLKLLEDIEVLDSLIPELDQELVDRGKQSPLFFGSAMTNFGVELFLKTFLKYARYPVGRSALLEGYQQEKEVEDSSSAVLTVGQGTSSTSSAAGGAAEIVIDPEFDEFTGFVFKLQANLDPKHRDRMAFVRICSGTFRKGMKVNHSRMKKSINLSSAQSLFAQDRESIIEAYPGDVIGIHNPGCFAIGDTIFTGNKRITYPGIPSFSPEKFAYLRNPNPSLYKKFQKGLSELLDEGAVQMLRERDDDGNMPPILAAVGQLQFEVVQYRLTAEYNVESKLEPISFTMARWVLSGWETVKKAEDEGKLYGVYVVKDRWDRPVLLFRNPWKVNQLVEEAKYLELAPWSMPPTEFFK